MSPGAQAGGRVHPSAFEEARGPANTLSVGFQASGQGESTSLLFRAPGFATLCYLSPRKLRHQAGHSYPFSI